jgi:hypothetical protein
MRILIALFISCGILCADTWSGALVDAKCFDAQDRNVNPTDTLTFVDRDRNREIRYCVPRAKTKSYSVVLPDGLSIHLDAAGNVKAADFVRAAGNREIFRVTVSGEKNGKQVRVDSIADAQ